DGAALAGAVAALEHDADLEPLVLDPLLQLDEFHVQLAQPLVVVLALELLARTVVVFGHRVLRDARYRQHGGCNTPRCRFGSLRACASPGCRGPGCRDPVCCDWAR